MKTPRVTIIDFETDPIQDRPNYPPKPVGFSIKQPGERKAAYYGWGHPTENNCSKRDAVRVLRSVWESDAVILFQNAKFDVDVAQTHMECGSISWERIHDTMYLLFLVDPHAPDLQLKPAAERILGMAPEEQDAVRDWIMAHKEQANAWLAQFGLQRDGKPLKITPTKFGAAIAFAPGKLVGTYANGDVIRTEALFKHCWPQVAERGMVEAYDRERELMPIFLENERVGMRVDLPALKRDIDLYQSALKGADAWLCKRLKVKELNLDNDREVAEALSNAGIVNDDAWTLTDSGQRSVSKKNLLPEMYNDSRVAKAFGYRNRLVTCLKMFMIPWARQASARGDSHISTNWNQVRQPGGGTRTGRPSCTDPNFLNLSKSWHDKDDGYEHPSFIKDLVELPLVRRYVLPDKGHVFLHRDFNGQELRILGHYEDGALLAAYQENPRMDVHAFVKDLILDITNLDYHRTQVKITNFRRIYGGGAPATASALNVSIDAAKKLLNAHGKALPGVKHLSAQIKALSKSGEPIITWGGREYYVEPPGFSKKHGRHMSYEYKLLNYLIQGSAADATKEAILRYHRDERKRGRFLVTVYDEINVSAPKADVRHEMEVLRQSMEGLEFDVPMLSDGKTGPNWADSKKYEDPQ